MQERLRDLERFILQKGIAALLVIPEGRELLQQMMDLKAQLN